MDNYVYEPCRGIFVGKFTEEEVAKGADQTAVKEMMAKTGLGYTNQEIVMKNNVAIGIKIWVCNANDFRLNYL